MTTGLSTDVLLALLDAPATGIGGMELQQRLGEHRQQPRSDQLLTSLLRLETTDHVVVRRAEGFTFLLSERGRARAYELGGGRPVHLRLLMADLVGFVAFTAEHGDEAAHHAASCLAAAASAAVRASGGEVVKGLGDGFLAWLPPTVDPLPIVVDLAERCLRPTNERWRLRAASHVGHPIRHGGDLFGGDVNLVARLCQAAEPDQLLMSRCAAPGDDVERLAVRGMAEPVAVARVPIR